MGAMRLRGGCESVELVGWYIMVLVIKVQNDWRDVWPGGLKLQCIAIITFLWSFSIFFSDGYR